MVSGNPEYDYCVPLNDGRPGVGFAGVLPLFLDLPPNLP